jgi:hypothetical protein
LRRRSCLEELDALSFVELGGAARNIIQQPKIILLITIRIDIESPSLRC